MRIFYIGVVIFGLLGIVVGYSIRPSRSEVALMYFKDRYYGKASIIYKNYYQKGIIRLRSSIHWQS